MKLYLARWEVDEVGGDILGWCFVSPDSAATWAYRKVAERHRRDFNRHGVTIPSPAGGAHMLRNFSIEHRPDGKCILACDAPTLATEAGSQVHAK